MRISCISKWHLLQIVIDTLRVKFFFMKFLTVWTVKKGLYLYKCTIVRFYTYIYSSAYTIYSLSFLNLFSAVELFPSSKYTFDPETGRAKPKWHKQGVMDASVFPKINNKGYLLGTCLWVWRVLLFIPVLSPCGTNTFFSAHN